MRIAVFIKEIPLKNSVEIDPITHNLLRTKQEGRINPFDEHALEQAMRLKEKYDAEVFVISMGPDNFKLSLYEALSYGLDEAYLLSSRAFAGSDTLATAYTLSQAIKKIGKIDLLFFGTKALDADTSQVPALIAQTFDMPQITHGESIHDIDLKEKTLEVTYRSDEAIVRVKTSLPLVVSMNDNDNEPRYLSPLNIKLALQKEITVWDEHDLACDLTRIGMDGSPSSVIDTYVPQKQARQAQMLEGTEQEAANKLISNLKERHLN